jgi:hypothetical protein
MFITVLGDYHKRNLMTRGSQGSPQTTGSDIQLQFLEI